MKKIVFFLSFISVFLFSASIFSAVTTTDGSITLDFYEDTQSGIDNRWILNFNANDVDGAGGIEIISYSLIFLNEAMDFYNQYNNLIAEYYKIGHFSSGTIPLHLWPAISTPEHGESIPVGESFSVYATPTKEGDPVIDNFWVKLRHTDNLGNDITEFLELTGPIDFSAVPEPMGILLFLLGSFFLNIFITHR